MKKFLGTMLAVILASSILAGCGKEESPVATDSAPAATDTTPAASEASPATTDTAATDVATTDVATADTETVAAVDLTAYPVMWCRETSLYPDTYENTYFITSATEVYDRTLVIGTEWTGIRLIDDTHAEQFRHFRINDDIDTSIMATSQDESIIQNDDLVNVIKISDREEEVIIDTYTYEINGTELILTEEQTSRTATLQLSPDFTNLIDDPYEYTYLTDF